MSQTQSRSKERIQVHYIALCFTGQFSFSTLKCHLNFGFTVPKEKHSPTLENHNGGTLPRPGIDFCKVLQCCHCCCGTRDTWCSMKDQLNDAGIQMLCPWRTLKMLFSCAASQYEGSVTLQYLGALLISGAYAFWTCCDFRIKHCGSGLSGWLPWSSRLVVDTYTNVSIHSQCNLQIQFKFVKLWRISLLSFLFILRSKSIMRLDRRRKTLSPTLIITDLGGKRSKTGLY